MKTFFLLIITLFGAFSFSTSTAMTVVMVDSAYFTEHQQEFYVFSDTIRKEKTSAHTSILTKDERKKKLLAEFFSFPFPLGFVGAHRILLGTKPWVPVVYVITFGGCFGLLPLVDFCVIAFSKDIEKFENNPNIFMWVK